MSNINDGGAAFPRIPHSGDASDDGMSLRDYFAAHADVSAYTPIETFEMANGRKPTILELAKYIANIRMIEADAMLADRKSHQPDDWIEWNGGKCPVPRGSKFWIKFRDGHACDAGNGTGLVWDHYGNDSDIIAYFIYNNGDQK